MFSARIHNHSFERMGERYARLIDGDHFLGRSAFDIHRPKPHPPTNVMKSGPLYELEMPVPGYNKDEIVILVKNDILTVKGEKTRSTAETTIDYLQKEFELDRFERSFRLEPGVGREKITANLQNGILKLTFIDVPPEEEKPSQRVEVM
ncbi:MAG: Hsp20/alpha crystallin family protein [Saprospiraceae bacterium]|nr:Hsp20/alpha crystallin family protein [Saprospiraceae bacterium]